MRPIYFTLWLQNQIKRLITRKYSFFATEPLLWLALEIKINGFEYLIKPIGNKELVARVRAALRRADLPSLGDKRRKVSYSDEFLTVDVVERKVTVNGERVKLTPREFRLLALLVDNAGHVLTHQQVLEKVWGWEYIDDVDYVRIYIAHLRRKIEPEPSLPRYIITEPGVGYYFHTGD